MANYTVEQVRMEWSNSGLRHEHIAGVCTSDGVYHSRMEVVQSLRMGNVWETLAEGSRARIREIALCKVPGCATTPYITTDRDASAIDNLDNLPRC